MKIATPPWKSHSLFPGNPPSKKWGPVKPLSFWEFGWTPRRKEGVHTIHAFFIFFLNWDSLHVRLKCCYNAWCYKKEAHKGYEYRKSVSKEPSVKRSMLILDLKPLRSQRKAFYRQRIPESSCVMKETVDIYTIVISSNGDRKIMQSTE